MRSLIAIFTFGALVAALLLSIMWFWSQPDADSRFEPALTFLVLSATITGIFVERWAGATERRQELLRGLFTELESNAKILGDPRFSPIREHQKRPKVYPRLLISTVDAVIGSNVLADHKDRRLLQMLHEWRDRVSEFNHRLDITELRTFTNPSKDELAQVENALQNPEGLLAHVRSQLDAIRQHLDKIYPKLRQYPQSSAMRVLAEVKVAAVRTRTTSPPSGSQAGTGSS